MAAIEVLLKPIHEIHRITISLSFQRFIDGRRRWLALQNLSDVIVVGFPMHERFSITDSRRAQNGVRQQIGRKLHALEGGVDRPGESLGERRLSDPANVFDQDRDTRENGDHQNIDRLTFAAKNGRKIVPGAATPAFAMGDEPGAGCPGCRRTRFGRIHQIALSDPVGFVCSRSTGLTQLGFANRCRHAAMSLRMVASRGTAKRALAAGSTRIWWVFGGWCWSSIPSRSGRLIPYRQCRD